MSVASLIIKIFVCFIKANVGLEKCYLCLLQFYFVDLSMVVYFAKLKACKDYWFHSKSLNILQIHYIKNQLKLEVYKSLLVLWILGMTVNFYDTLWSIKHVSDWVFWIKDTVTLV